MEKIGDKIKRLRIKKGYNQSNLNVSQPTVNTIENGKVNPKSDTLEKIAQGLDLSFSELIKDTDWVTPSTINNNSIAVSESDFELKVIDKYNFQIDTHYFHG